jgi:maleylpyruvate isomerase
VTDRDDRNDTALTLPWMRAGTGHVFALVAKLSDAELAEPSALPEWSRAHVVAHLARNAEALIRLVTWARTGVETPMYPSRDARAADIAASAGHPPERLRAELADTAAELDAALTALTSAQWQAQVRSALGRPLPAAQVPWMRIREVWLHAVDLDAGAEVADVPDGVLDLLLDEVTGTLSAADGCPAVELVPTDRDRRFLLGADGSRAVEIAPADRDLRFPLGADGGPAAGPAPTDHGLRGSDDAAPVVTAPAAALVGWLTGRMQAPPGAPELPRWL